MIRCRLTHDTRIYIFLLVTVTVLASCHHSSGESASPEHPQRESQPLLEKDVSDFLPRNTGLPKRVMSNAGARMRYALDLMQAPGHPYWQNDLAKSALDVWQTSNVPWTVSIEGFFKAEADPASVADLHSQIAAEEAGKKQRTFQPSRLFSLYLRAVSHRHSCEQQGYQGLSCCQSMLLPWSTLRLDDFDEFQNIRDHYFPNDPKGFWDKIVFQKNTYGESTNAFSQLVETSDLFLVNGLDAWLMACGEIVAHRHTAPIQNLEMFIQKHGNYKTWPSVFLPVSNAKRMGRRIYRHPTGQVRMAETVYVGPAHRVDTPKDGENAFNPGWKDCQTRETEVIEILPNGALFFSAFNARGQSVPFSTFTDRSMNNETASPTPFTCIGCHYTRSTRLVDAIAPNIEELGLDFERLDHPPVRRSAKDCHP